MIIRSDVLRAIVVMFALGVASMVQADLLNTASISFRDATGNHTIPSNTVLVTVTANPASGALPDPVLTDIEGKTFGIRDSLSLTYGGNASGFNWQFDLEAAASAGAQRSLTPARATSGAIATRTPQLSLSALSLSAGQYLVKVQAVNGSQFSNWVSAHISVVNSDLSRVRVYPNPWRNDLHRSRPLTFEGLSSNSVIKIFSVSGRVIRSVNVSSNQYMWDLTTDSGENAPSGLYVYLVTDADGNKAKGKFALVR